MVSLIATEAPNPSLIAMLLEKLRKYLTSKFVSKKILIKRVSGHLSRVIRKKISKRTTHPTFTVKHRHHGA